MSVRREFCGLSLIALAAASVCGQANAQVATATVDTSGDIIVTANKREQNLNDVGLAVNVLSGDALAARGISTLEEIANTVPGLSYSNTVFGAPVYTLRGIGFNETSLGAYPTTSVYLDEVPLSFPALTKHSAFDVQRIEILKGPQGTLFGQNSTGGAINYIANKPGQSLEAGATISYGRFNEANAEAYLSGPLSDKISARLSGRIETADGWQVSNTRPDDRNGKTRAYMGRLLVDFAPTESVQFLLNLNGWIDKTEPQAPQYIALFPQFVGSVSPAVLAESFSPLTNRAADWTPGLPRADNSFWQASLRGDIDVTDSIKLTSITAYSHYSQDQGEDYDGLAAMDQDYPDDRGWIRSFTQELRLAGDNAGFRWVVGGNFERSISFQAISNDYRDSTSTQVVSALGYFITTQTFSNKQKMRNIAGFGNVEYDIAPNVTLKGGLRYTEARRSSDACATENTGRNNDYGSFIYDIILGGSAGPFTPGDCVAANLTLPGRQPEVIGGIQPGSPGRYVASMTEHNASWRVGIDYKPWQRFLLYANVSKGYKAGSYPTLSVTNVSQYLPVTQESVLAYEAGLKFGTSDRKLQLNAAAFWYAYNDKQLRTKYVDPIFGILDILQNVPKSTVKGFELEAIVRPVPQLSFSAAFTYLDAKIDRFTGTGVSGNAQDFAGSEIPYTPKYQVNMNIDYETNISNRLQAFVGISQTFRSKATAAIGGDVNPINTISSVPLIFQVDDYTLIDARFGLRSSDNSWRITGWIKNVFNEYYYNNVVPDFDTFGRYAGKPRTYGISLSYKL